MSVALHHYMCFVIVAHHVPHTTVPANRPHRPVSAPPKRSPPAETGQPVRTHYGVRGRRLARRLHPCALAVRPPFDARPKWSSTLKRWVFQKRAVSLRGTARKGSTIRRKGGPEREGRSGNGSPDGSRPAHGRLWIALGVKPQAGSAYGQPVTGRTGKQADRQSGRLSGMQAVGGSSSGSSPDGGLMSPCLRISRADRFQGRCGPVTYADMQTCKPPYGLEGRRPRLRSRLRAARAPRRSITDVGILNKHEGAGPVLQLPAHAI